MKNINNQLSDEEFFDLFADAMGKALNEQIKFRSPNRLKQHQSSKPHSGISEYKS